MHTKDAIRFALTVSNGAVLSVIDEMSGAATTIPTPNGGCHPLWVLGHLTLVEGSIPAILFGDKNPAAGWQSYFGENSEPVADASTYPPIAEIRKKYQQLREQNLKVPESLSEADLVMERHYDQQQIGGPLTFDDLSFGVVDPAVGFERPS
jgi:DinB superfamily